MPSIHKDACHISNLISKKTVIASFDVGTRTRQWLESLRDDQWFITSFIPETRMVCAAVYGSRGTVTHLALTLPNTIKNN